MKTYKLRSELPRPTLGGLIGPGDIKYVDVNGDGVIDSYDQVRGVGNPSTPEIIYLVLTLSTKASMRVSFFREQAIHLFFWEEPLPKDGIRSLGASTSPIIARLL